MKRFRCLLLALALIGAADAAVRADHDSLVRKVREAETAFAKTMADRNLDRFVTFVDEEAVFFGPAGALKGVKAVKAAWAGFFVGPEAPFSWQPEEVEVLESGDLAFSSGPVMDPQGRKIGIFNSVWRRGSDGRWKVIFDKGCPACVESAGATADDGAP